MGIWITILLALLPKLLEWLLSLLGQGRQVPARLVGDLERITWYTNKINDAAPKVGLSPGGKAPPLQAVGHSHDHHNNHKAAEHCCDVIDSLSVALISIKAHADCCGEDGLECCRQSQSLIAEAIKLHLDSLCEHKHEEEEHGS